MGRARLPDVGGVMLIYWLMFGFPAAMALIEAIDEERRGRFGFAWLLMALALVVLIGFRWETGGDWGNYQRIVEEAMWNPLQLSPLGDPGFTLLSHYAAHTNLGLLVITIASGVLMGATLTRFCLAQPRPWLCMAVAVPYLVVVMGMGYIRQGMAISFLMMGLVSLQRGNVWRYYAWICCGALFHSTALALLPLGALVGGRNQLMRILLALLLLALLSWAILTTHENSYVKTYLVAGMDSAGAAIRLFMCALPGAIFLVFRARFDLEEPKRDVWTVLSLAALAAFAALFVSRSSTVVDRLGLYLIPLQCLVYARMPIALANDRRGDRLLTVSILALYALSFFVWLNFADNVDYWLPYRSLFFQDDLCLAC